MRLVLGLVVAAVTAASAPPSLPPTPVAGTLTLSPATATPGQTVFARAKATGSDCLLSYGDGAAVETPCTGDGLVQVPVAVPSGAPTGTVTVRLTVCRLSCLTRSRIAVVRNATFAGLLSVVAPPTTTPAPPPTTTRTRTSSPAPSPRPSSSSPRPTPTPHPPPPPPPGHGPTKAELLAGGGSVLLAGLAAAVLVRRRSRSRWRLAPGSVVSARRRSQPPAPMRPEGRTARLTVGVRLRTLPLPRRIDLP